METIENLFKEITDLADEKFKNIHEDEWPYENISRFSINLEKSKDDKWVVRLNCNNMDCNGPVTFSINHLEGEGDSVKSFDYDFFGNHENLLTALRILYVAISNFNVKIKPLPKDYNIMIQGHFYERKPRLLGNKFYLRS